MATYGLQNRLSQLKEEKAQWESLERSEEVIQVLGPALKSLHKNKARTFCLNRLFGWL